MYFMDEKKDTLCINIFNIEIRERPLDKNYYFRQIQSLFFFFFLITFCACTFFFFIRIILYLSVFARV